MAEKRTIFFGTGNRKKIGEILQILGDTFEVKNFGDLAEIPEVEETESTLQGNARLKAEAFFQLTGLPCFADDTGLEVEALNGAPGVYSARYAGPEGDAQRNMEKLLGALSGESNRKAAFRTVIAWYDGSEIQYFEGKLAGEIIDTPRGTNGFGYDPIFVPEGYTQTLAELSADEKNKISHRGIAVRKFAAYLIP